MKNVNMGQDTIREVMEWKEGDFMKRKKSAFFL